MTFMDNTPSATLVPLTQLSFVHIYWGLKSSKDLYVYCRLSCIYVSRRSHESHRERIVTLAFSFGVCTFGFADKLRELLSMQPTS